MTDNNIEHQQDDSQVEEKKKPGRKRNENFLSWEEAREFMHSEMIPSRTKFMEWWDRNKPKAIPRFPYRVYKEWTSWNDFLGTNNEFKKKPGKYRPLEEACLWVHKQKIETYQQWLDWCKEQKEADTMPADIPTRPDLVYKNWRSWGHWLGNKPTAVVEVKQEAQKLAVYYIIHYDGVPDNVFEFGVEPGGLNALKESWEHEHFTTVKLFWFDQQKASTVKQIIDAMSSSYLGVDKQRVAHNVWEIVWLLQIHLETITQQELNAYITR